MNDVFSFIKKVEGDFSKVDNPAFIIIDWYVTLSRTQRENIDFIHDGRKSKPYVIAMDSLEELLYGAIGRLSNERPIYIYRVKKSLYQNHGYYVYYYTIKD